MSASTYALLIFPPLCWAGNFIAGRAVADQVPPLALASIRWGLALCFLAPFAWRTVLTQRVVLWQARWLVLGTALTGVLGFNLLVYWGLHTTSASHGLILNACIPFLVAILGWMLYQQPVRSGSLLGLWLSLAGVLVVIAQGDWSRLRLLQVSSGDILMLCAMLCWAFYTCWLKALPEQLNRVGLMAVQVVIALVVLLPLTWLEAQHVSLTVSRVSTWWILAYVGFFPSVLAFLAYGQAVARVGPMLASGYIHLMPVFGVLLAAWLLDEAVQPYQWLGMVLIFAGLLLASRLGKVTPKMK